MKKLLSQYRNSSLQTSKKLRNKKQILTRICLSTWSHWIPVHSPQNPQTNLNRYSEYSVLRAVQRYDSMYIRQVTSDIVYLSNSLSMSNVKYLVLNVCTDLLLTLKLLVNSATWRKMMKMVLCCHRHITSRIQTSHWRKFSFSYKIQEWKLVC